MRESLLLEYRRQIEAKRLDVERYLSTWDDIALERAADTLDEVRLADDRDLAIATKDRSTALLRQLRSALERLDDGTFGICLSCGNEISSARLHAVPWAGFCIRCQEAMDMEEHPEAGAVEIVASDELDEAA